jgi:hypothetical protein
MATNKAGGGINSRVVKQVPQRLGQKATGVSPGWASQIGEGIGNHVTGHGGRSATGYRGEAMRDGKTPAGGKVPLGNSLTNNVGRGGPGTGRTVHGCGSQTGVSPTRSPNASGRDILSEFGPESKRR